MRFNLHMVLGLFIILICGLLRLLGRGRRGQAEVILIHGGCRHKGRAKLLGKGLCSAAAFFCDAPAHLEVEAANLCISSISGQADPKP